MLVRLLIMPRLTSWRSILGVLQGKQALIPGDPRARVRDRAGSAARSRSGGPSNRSRCARPMDDLPPERPGCAHSRGGKCYCRAAAPPSNDQHIDRTVSQCSCQACPRPFDGCEFYSGKPILVFSQCCSQIARGDGRAKTDRKAAGFPPSLRFRCCDKHIDLF